jgi:hypothetical protein
MLPHQGHAAAKAIINRLETHKYVDQATRVVIVEFTVFNSMVNVWSAVRISAEMTASGGCTASSEFVTANLYEMVVDLKQGLSLIFRPVVLVEILTLLFYLSYAIVDVVGCYRMGRKECQAHVLEFVPIIHRLNLILYFIRVAIRFVGFTSLPGDVMPDSDMYYDYQTAAILSHLSTGIGAINSYVFGSSARVRRVGGGGRDHGPRIKSGTPTKWYRTCMVDNSVC